MLNLSHNSLQGLDNNLFKHMGNLKVLDLSFNRLNNLPHDIFEVLEDLKSLHINDNELEYIHPNSIGNLTSLHTLRIDSNALETLHQSALPQNMSSFTRLKLQVRNIFILHDFSHTIFSKAALMRQFAVTCKLNTIIIAIYFSS